MTDLVPHTRHSSELSFADQAEFARMVTSGGRAQSILPDTYRDNPANVLIAVGLGASMGLSPAESLYRISVIKGKPSAGAELIAANVRRAGHKLRVRVTENPPSATAQIIRADDPDFPFEVTRDMDWAKQMGLASNDNYKKQASTMLQWRAITAVARLACPEALYGVAYTPDEVGEAAGPEQPAQRRVSAEDFIGRAVTASRRPDPAPVDVSDAQVLPDEPAEQKITPAQMRKMRALMAEAGLTDPDEARAYAGARVGREDLDSSKNLTRTEAATVIDALEQLLNPPQPEDDGTRQQTGPDLLDTAQEQEAGQ